MNDIIWYSRFAVLVGALVLLVQAVAGRAAGFITLLAVVLLCAGFIAFVVALGAQGWSSNRSQAEILPDGDTGLVEPPSDPPSTLMENHREVVERGADSETAES